MSVVNITSVNVLDNPCAFIDPIKFEIHYECLTDLEEDLEWKLVYIGSAESEKYDQVLDNVMVGPVKQGKFKFVLQTDAPKADEIPVNDIVGVTAILLTCSYKDAEFLRVGYYASIAYEDEQLRETPPDKPVIAKLKRRIIAENPRVTRYANRFDSPESEYAQSEEIVEAEEGEEVDGLEEYGNEEEGEEEDDDEDDENEDDAANRNAMDEGRRLYQQVPDISEHDRTLDFWTLTLVNDTDGL